MHDPAHFNVTSVESSKVDKEAVTLVNDNLVFDQAMPTKLLNTCNIRAGREFTSIRYSAATCDPNHFKDSGFMLRQNNYAQDYTPPRKTELFIVITMYNEDEKLFCGTMAAVVENIQALCTPGILEEEGWQQVVVCIVADGRLKVAPLTLDAIAAIGAYQKGVAQVSRSSH